MPTLQYQKIKISISYWSSTPAESARSTRAATRWVRTAALAAGVLCGVGVWSAQGAGFDCTKAATPIEKMICANDTLSKLDDALAAAYRLARSKAIDPPAQVDAQRRWIKRLRNKAASPAALSACYRVRLALLQEVTRVHQGEDCSWMMVPVGTSGDGLFPRLKDYRDTAVITKVNKRLDELRETFSCFDQPEGDNEGDYDVGGKVTYAQNSILSIEIHSGYNCGTTYPTNDFNQSLTFDMRTGATVGFEELFRDFAKNRRMIITVLFGELIERTAHSAASDDNEGCGDVLTLDGLEGNNFSYHLTPQGVVVQPSFAHAVEACAESVVAPYQRLGRFLSPTGILGRWATP